MLRTSFVAAMAALAIGGVVSAQQMTPPGGQMAPPAAKRTILQKFDVPAGDRETVVVLIESAPNTDFARHTHPGPETGYVVEGEFTQTVDGQSPKLLKVGDSYYVSAGTIHSARSGPNGAKVVGVFIVEKGKPLTSPAP
jgi:quercetin dioxygenase-like cupin family protein